ncbi:MAG: M67 family metallopeptidase [Pseudomonadota bacterium]
MVEATTLSRRPETGLGPSNRISKAVMALENIETAASATHWVALPRELQDEFRQHALHQLPQEACALLLGERVSDGMQISRLFLCKNAADAPTARFLIAPADLFAAHRLARENQIEVVGHLHSHPSGCAMPSGTDVKNITDPNTIWMIQAVSKGSAGALAAYLPKKDGSGFKSLAIRGRAP